MPRRKPKIRLSQIKKTHKDVAKLLIDGRTPEEIEKLIIVINAVTEVTNKKQLEFQKIIRTKWDEYCDLMASAPKVSSMFEALFNNRSILRETRSDIEIKIGEKERGLKSYFLKNEVKELKTRANLLDEKTQVFDEEINKRFDEYCPIVVHKVLNNSEVQTVLAEFPLKMEIEFTKLEFKNHPAKGDWHSFVERFKTAYLPKAVPTGNMKWVLAFPDEVTAAMKAQIPNVKKKLTTSRLKAQAAENKDAQRNLVSSYRTQKTFRMQTERLSGCPYCGNYFEGNVLNRTVELDHIYPVSKGGQSVNENLVFICSDCNSKKSNDTLIIFCNKNNYEYDAVIKNLLRLGKDV